MTAETADAALIIIPGRITLFCLLCIALPSNCFGINRTHLNASAAPGTLPRRDDRPPGEVAPQSKQERVCRQARWLRPFDPKGAINKFLKRITRELDILHDADTKPGRDTRIYRRDKFRRAIHEPASNRV